VTVSLEASDLAADPLAQFDRWFEDARSAGIQLSEAVALATATPDGLPSARMVLLKAFDERGFAFFTNLESSKAAELGSNPRAALLFHWKELSRQVRVEGAITPVNRSEVEEYARKRSRDSQLSALASPQSHPVDDREWLERRVAELAARHPDEVPVSESWGGFRVIPSAYEFWQSGEHRLHDRFRYHPVDGGWAIERLAP
jgi:pyridoxamine 5'-phosphate oxidase